MFIPHLIGWPPGVQISAQVDKELETHWESSRFSHQTAHCSIPRKQNTLGNKQDSTVCKCVCGKPAGLVIIDIFL